MRGKMKVKTYLKRRRRRGCCCGKVKVEIRVKGNVEVKGAYGAKTPLPGAEFKIWPKVCSGGDLFRK